jgi:hypothetical protein
MRTTIAVVAVVAALVGSVTVVTFVVQHTLTRPCDSTAALPWLRC